MICDLIVHHARQLVTMSPGGSGPRRGEQMEDLGLIEDGACAAEKGNIVAAGPTDEVLSACTLCEGGTEIDATGQVVMPGFVDPHTHPVFAGSREDEFEQRLRGASYEEIARRGGGIRATVRKVREASREALFAETLPRLNRLLAHGTTTIEAKSGYGLSTADEIKLLEVIRDLQAVHPLELVPTFLGAHEIPDDYRTNAEAYVDLVIDEMIPKVSGRKLAEFCDVFCEEDVFDVDQSRRILSAARSAGLKLKLHADELSPLGGAELAAELGAASADHLLAVSDCGIAALADRNVIAVLLPGTTFSLGKKTYAPARTMIRAGVPVALGTDLNPGSCFTESMPIIITLACLMMGLSPAEAITAATVNAACAVNREAVAGSLEQGKQADLVVWDMPDYRHLPYHFGVNLVRTVIKKGVVVVERSHTS